jgi:chitin disaccharide deacetylase
VPDRFAVINADDFGISHSVNQAIVTAHAEGILTSASLMVTGDAYTAAVDLAHRYPHLGVGLHLVIVKGRSVLSSDKIPHLVDAAGCFLDQPARAGWRYQFIPQARQELYLEIRAQLERFRHTGLTLSHVDGHTHLHCHPVVIEILCQLAPEFKIPLIRLPQEELGFNLDWDDRHRVLKTLWWWVFGRLSRHAAPRLRRSQVGYLQRVYGLLQTGQISEAYLLDLIPRIQANRIEIYAHPAIAAPPHSGITELAALLSDRVRLAFESQGWKLVNFHQLAQQSR